MNSEQVKSALKIQRNKFENKELVEKSSGEKHKVFAVFPLSFPDGSFNVFVGLENKAGTVMFQGIPEIIPEFYEFSDINVF